MLSKKTIFAVMFGNRGCFPASLQATARKEVTKALEKLGHDIILLPEEATNHGAVETVAEGKKFAGFLHENKGRYGGVILSLPNFGDELGAAAALKDVDVPVFIQAYPDEIDKLDVAHRRDSFCGKFALCDVLLQCGVKFTTLSPHVVHPTSHAFADNIDFFDSVCNVVNGMRDMTVLAIGARTTPFKSVRTDELALQKRGITVETLDMSSVISRVQNMDANSAGVKRMAETLNGKADFSAVPEKQFLNLCRLGATLDDLIEQYEADAVAIRCWLELQHQLGVSPCFLNGLLCDRGIPTACEVDISNAVMMAALQYASGSPATILDWNNNYSDADDKCILFHCGNVAPSMRIQCEKIIEHAIFAETGCADTSWGCSCGRIRPMDMTFGSALTADGRVKAYLGKGRITEDVIPAESFGCAGVAQIDNLQDILNRICRTGHRHHVSLCEGDVSAPIAEAFENYLGIEVEQV
jgi:L-fucose isomerase-like protein